MKKLLFIILAGMLFTSCDKLLDESPDYSVNSTNVFDNTTTTQTALNACYGYLINWNGYGQAYFELTLGASGLSWAQTNGSDQDYLVSLNTLNSNGTLGQVWTGFYKTIGECNSFVQNIEGGSLTTDQKNYYAAQARFIRGLCYYNLAGIFGDVPLRIAASDVDSLNMARTPVAEVYNQVATDWKFAAQYLPEELTSDQSTYSMPTKYTAYAYLAKLYWTLGSKENASSSSNWGVAKAYGDSVINAGVYALQSNYNQLFVTGENDTKESIFKLNVSTSLSGMGSRLSWLFAPYGSTTGISWARFKPSKAFYNWFKGTYPDDPRLKVAFSNSYTTLSNSKKSYAYPNISYSATVNGVAQTIVDSLDYSKLADPTNPTIDEITAQNAKFAAVWTASTGSNEGWPFYAKYIDPNATAQLGNKQILVYRYADFLLLMADVNNELGNTAVAVSLINQVLTRARNSATPTSTYPENVSGSISQTALRDKIFNERLFELAGEPDNFYDVRRRGTEYFKHVLERNNNDHITAAFAGNSAVSLNTYKDRLFNNGTLSDDFLKKNLLEPIPQTELNTNTQITAGDQNFGY
ncbi:Starch-binding associating with outer membrane [Arachidicoccus rhizosphaerae]|uniref:Starch-binding associating with outer membrane n=1 Tax=Arachidicoccus rhizosphaerae TaxID=551991 RepID=A0A1H4BFK1_9BACT|nr:RagB/SusD family nutrient uptake outer membrane protein [Arachidicoccus rhizosphaerae]SEA46877.1 Starch-binding associating with outer membrane [Arachidicoccus rhizosphaerae]